MVDIAASRVEDPYKVSTEALPTSAAIWMSGFFGEERLVAEDLIAEGLTVAAWVALGEAPARFIAEWPIFWGGIRGFRRPAGTPLVFGTRGRDGFPAVKRRGLRRALDNACRPA